MKTPFIPCSARLSLVAALVLASACSDDPVAPLRTQEPVYITSEYVCTVEVAAGTTQCELAFASPDGLLLDLVLGSPYVYIVSSGTASYRAQPANEDTTTVNMAVRNQAVQPIGTTDGISAHPSGVRMLFSSGPTITAVNSGTIAGSTIQVNNPDGTGTFGTYVSRPYYEYSGILANGNTSAAKSVRFIYSANVKTFSYGLRVSAPVQYEQGWITISPAPAPILAPGGTTTLTGTVYNQVGQVQADGITWATSNSSVAVVNASTGQVTAVGEGTAMIVATSTVNAQRTGTRLVAVDAVPAVTGTTPANGSEGVGTGDNIVITFNEAVNVSAASFSLECPAGSPQGFTVSGSGTATVTLNPVADLPHATLCSAIVLASEVSDVDTNDGPDMMAADYAFSFEATIRAYDDVFSGLIVTDINSAPFSVTANDQVTASTTIVFEGWDGMSGFTEHGGYVTMDTEGVGMGQFTYEPAAGFAGTDRFIYTIQSGSATSVGTVTLTVDAVPVVTGSTPANEAEDVGQDIDIDIAFSEPVSATTSSFTLVCSSGTKSFTVSGSGTDTVTLHPNVWLPSQESCTVTVVATNVNDADVNGPNHPASNFVFTFSVGFTEEP
jgi:hypothetical protein